jgi:hypothetical protein
MVSAAESAQPGAVTLPHERASEYRVVLADGATVTVLDDPVGSTVYLTFTRIDATPESESFVGVVSSTGVAQRGPSTFNARNAKVQEVTIALRPDHAFAVSRAVFERLREFDESRRARYNLPEIRLDTR